MARLPQVVSLIGKKQYFVVHAQRQCGKPLVVFDPKLGDWDAKLRHEDIERGGKTIHVFFC